MQTVETTQERPANLSICALELPVSANSASSKAQARPFIALSRVTSVERADEYHTAQPDGPHFSGRLCRDFRPGSSQAQDDDSLKLICVEGYQVRTALQHASVLQCLGAA